MLQQTSAVFWRACQPWWIEGHISTYHGLVHGLNLGPNIGRCKNLGDHPGFGRASAVRNCACFWWFFQLARPPVNWDIDMENPMVFRKMIYCIYECLVSLISKYLLIYSIYWREEVARTEVSQETIERNPPKTRTPRSPCVGSGWYELLAAQSIDKVGQDRNQEWNTIQDKEEVETNDQSYSHDLNLRCNSQYGLVMFRIQNLNPVWQNSGSRCGCAPPTERHVWCCGGVKWLYHVISYHSCDFSTWSSQFFLHKIAAAS